MMFSARVSFVAWRIAVQQDRFSFLQSAARWRLSAYGANPQFATFFCRGRFSKMSGLTLGKVGRVKLTEAV